MSNSTGKQFVVTCFGESHGSCVGAVIDGCPAGLALSIGDIQKELDKRIPPAPELVSGRIEKDVVEILSGVFDGFTTGAPICVLVRNREFRPSEYDSLKDSPRPGHADYPAHVKYGGFNDYRGGGRFSGRITVAFIMAGAIAKKLLNLFNIEVVAFTTSIGDVRLGRTPSMEEIRESTYESPVRCPDLEASRLMEKSILKARRDGDSLGGLVECFAANVPVGIGEPVFDSLDAEIAKMLFNVPAVKGVEFGSGFGVAQMRGSENNDAYAVQRGRIVALTNSAGGVLGGLSSGMPVVVRVALKPPSSISKRQRTVDLSSNKETTIEVHGRHDPCIVPKAVPVIESAVAIVLTDHMLRAGAIPRILRDEGNHEQDPKTQM